MNLTRLTILLSLLSSKMSFAFQPLPRVSLLQTTYDPIPLSKLSPMPPTSLMATKDVVQSSFPPPNAVVSKVSKSIRRVSWLSWWVLLLLNISTLSTLLFSRTLLTTTSSQIVSGIGGGIFLTILGGIINVFQVPWMWGYAR